MNDIKGTPNSLGPNTEFKVGERSFSIPILSMRTCRNLWPMITRFITPAVLAAPEGQEAPEASFEVLMENGFDRAWAACQIIIGACGGNPEGGEAVALEASMKLTERNDLTAGVMKVLNDCGLFSGPGTGAGTSTEGNASPPASLEVQNGGNSGTLTV